MVNMRARVLEKMYFFVVGRNRLGEEHIKNTDGGKINIFFFCLLHVAGKNTKELNIRTD